MVNAPPDNSLLPKGFEASTTELLNKPGSSQLLRQLMVSSSWSLLTVYLQVWANPSSKDIVVDHSQSTNLTLQ